jgi:molybdate transport system substrate-binding protein
MTGARRALGAVALLVPLLALGSGKQGPLLLAAVSLAPAVEEVLALPGAPRATLSAAGTGELVRQVRAGVKADVAFLADAESVAGLAKEGRVRASRALLSNRLAVVVPATAPWPAGVDVREALATAKRVGVADPVAVPAGRYAKGWLERSGLWASVAPRVVPLLDARATVAAVATGRVDAAVVYATDARRTPGVRVLHEVPAAETPDIRCVLALLSDGAEARALYEWLAGEPARAKYEAAGFQVVPP